MGIFVNARFLTQPVSGVQRYGIECSRQIKKLYPDVTFVAPGNILHRSLADELGVKITGYNHGHLWEQADLPLLMAKHKHPPLLNLANTGPLLYSNNYIAIHDLAFYHHPEWNSKMFSAWYNILIPRLAEGSRHIFTVSGTMKDELMKYYHLPAGKISVTYNGISAAMEAKGRGKRLRKEKMILMVGTFNKRKNHQHLINAFLESGIKDTYQLVMVGDRNKVFSESGLDETKLAGSNIIIYPTLSEDELISMYQRAEIVVSLSLYEGFGIPVLEGLYNGCKIICSDIQVYRELYDGYAHFCDPENTSEVADALKKVAGNADIIKENDITALYERYNYKRSAQIILGTLTK